MGRTRNDLIYTITGKGCFVSELSSDEALQKRNEMIMKQMVKDVSNYKSFGDDIIELLKDSY